jgi:hypothetical protein
VLGNTKRSCGCTGQDIRERRRPCEYYTQERESFGDFTYGMGGYLNRIEELRLKCALRSQVRKVAVASRCFLHSQPGGLPKGMRATRENMVEVYRRNEGATGHLRYAGLL